MYVYICIYAYTFGWHTEHPSSFCIATSRSGASREMRKSWEISLYVSTYVSLYVSVGSLEKVCLAAVCLSLLYSSTYVSLYVSLYVSVGSLEKVCLAAESVSLSYSSVASYLYACNSRGAISNGSAAPANKHTYTHTHTRT